MPRRARAFPNDSVLHVLNRGNERRRLFADDAEYAQFLWILDRARRSVPLEIYGYVLMPNHWHLVLRAADVRELSQFMHRLSATHAVVLRRQTASLGLGHVYQGRYRAAVIDTNLRYARTVRYVEANPVRARLVARAEDWPWSSLRERLFGVCRLSRGPVSLPEADRWAALVNRAGRRMPPEPF